MSAYPDTQRDVEVSPRKLSRDRAVALIVVAAIVAVIVVLFFFVRGPLLLGLGRIAGSSRTLAVLLGWSVWGAPLVLTLLFGRVLREHRELHRGARIVLVAALVCAWLPAVALLPGRSSEAEQQFASLAIAEAPIVGRSLLFGVYAGAFATLLSIPALILTVIPRRRHPPRFARLDRVARPLALVAVSLLGLGAGLAFGRVGPPGLPVNQLWPSGPSFTFNGKFVRVLGASHSPGCAGIVQPARAARVLEDDGCGGSERGLFTDSHDDALVAAAVIAMPTSGLAHDAALALDRLNAFAVPLPTPRGYGRSLNGATSATVAEGVGNELVLIDTGHADGRPRYVDTKSEQTLGVAVANTLISTITGVA